MFRGRDLKSSVGGPVLGAVLRGDFPEGAVAAMPRPKLEKLVRKLVQCTADAAVAKNGGAKNGGFARPPWWPQDLPCNAAVDLGLEDEGAVEQALRDLVLSCTQFFRKLDRSAARARPRWRPNSMDTKDHYQHTYNDENSNKVSGGTVVKGAAAKHRASPEILCGGVGRKRFKPFVEIRAAPAPEAFVPLEDILRVPATPPPAPPTKSEFLLYFELDDGCPNSDRRQRSAAPSPPIYVPRYRHLHGKDKSKFSSRDDIPFSSDFGLLMARREHHGLSEELQLKRIERGEWYVTYPLWQRKERLYQSLHNQFAERRRARHCHVYKMPKRQQHQRHLSLHHSHFLLRFCHPLSVRLELVDIDRLNAEWRRRAKRRLVVVIDESERMLCDSKKRSPELVPVLSRLVRSKSAPPPATSGATRSSARASKRPRSA